MGSSASADIAKPLSSPAPSNAMATDQSNPGDFISLLSSEDETPLVKKRKSTADNSTSIGVPDASAERSKRARVSSASADSTAGAKVSEEGEIDDDEDCEGGGEEKKTRGFASSGVFMPKKPPVFTSDLTSLQLPVFSQQREGTWHARFKEWAQLLCATNSPSAAKVTPELIRSAYKQYIDIHSRLKPNKKRAARQAADQCEDASLTDLIKSLQPRQADAARLQVAEEEASAGPKLQIDASSQLPAVQASYKTESPTAVLPLPPSPLLTAQTDDIFVIDVKPQPSAKTTMSQRQGLPSGDDALEQQRRYFPSASDPSIMCLLCGREGHVANDCTKCACKFCGQDDHWQYTCPSLDLKCNNCDIRGHSTAGCATVKEDRGYQFKCSFCHSTEHKDEQCTQPWRSFHPEPETIKTVTVLPVSCASCGSSLHFSANCAMDKLPLDPVNPTWSLYNMGQYIDSASSSSAIVGTDECTSSQRPGGLKIRGHASRTSQVRYYSDSDDSDDVQFLSQRVTPKPLRTGRIQLSTGLQPPNGDQQPPLPPGPPPPELPPPPTNRASRYSYWQALAGSTSLPARPPVPSRDYSNVPPPPAQAAQESRQQPSRGGRGGSRGGGRGGGRGGKGGRGGNSGGGGRGYRGGRFRGVKGRGG